MREQSSLAACRFESFLANKYAAAKRFGLEGCETLIPGMKAMIDHAAELGVETVCIGMPHRGKLSHHPVMSYDRPRILRGPVQSVMQLGVETVCIGMPHRGEMECTLTSDHRPCTMSCSWFHGQHMHGCIARERGSLSQLVCS